MPGSARFLNPYIDDPFASEEHVVLFGDLHPGGEGGGGTLGYQVGVADLGLNGYSRLQAERSCRGRSEPRIETAEAIDETDQFIELERNYSCSEDGFLVVDSDWSFLVTIPTIESNDE